MTRTIMRWLAFLGAAAAVVVTVYVVFDALVDVAPVALAPAPAMPEHGNAGAVIVDVASEPPVRPAPRTRANASAARPSSTRAAQAPEPSSSPAPAASAEQPATPRPAAPLPRQRPAERPGPVVEAPLDLYRALAESRAKKQKRQPDAGVPAETARPPAAAPPKERAARTRQPDAGVPAEPTRPAAPAPPAQAKKSPQSPR